MPLEWSAVGDWIVAVLSVLIAPAAALVGAFGGARYADKRSRERDDESRRHAHRVASREIVAELVDSGIAWCGDMMGYVTTEVAAARANMSMTDERLATGRTANAALSRHERAISTFVLSVSDSEPRAAVLALKEKLAELPTATSDVMSAAIRGQSATAQQMAVVFDYFESYRRHVRALSEALAPYVATELGGPDDR